MSCNNWERGTIKIPANQWVAFRKGLLTAWNRKQGADRLKVMKDELHTLYPVSKSATITLPDAVVVLDNTTKSVTWSVPENNHAVDDANAHWFARELFGALRRIRWTRGSGGTIVGNDEYNQDDRECGGGANYVTAKYGPSTQCDSGRCR